MNDECLFLEISPKARAEEVIAARLMDNFYAYRDSSSGRLSGYEGCPDVTFSTV